MPPSEKSSPKCHNFLEGCPDDLTYKGYRVGAPFLRSNKDSNLQQWEKSRKFPKRADKKTAAWERRWDETSSPHYTSVILLLFGLKMNRKSFDSQVTTRLREMCQSNRMGGNFEKFGKARQRSFHCILFLIITYIISQTH